jgi:hypothetical protein
VQQGAGHFHELIEGGAKGFLVVKKKGGQCWAMSENQ